MIFAIFSIPVDIGRDEARELAQQELLDPVYAEARPPWWQRLTSWALDRLTDVLDRVGDAAGTVLWVLVLAVVVALIALVIVRRTGGLQRSRAGTRDVFTQQELTADEHRSLAEKAAADQEWAAAIREEFRAIVRQLEERGAIDRQPGRTADEAARAAGVVFGALRVQLKDAARTFDEVVYGDRPGTPAEYRSAHRLDRELASTSQVAI